MFECILGTACRYDPRATLYAKLSSKLRLLDADRSCCFEAGAAAKFACAPAVQRGFPVTSAKAFWRTATNQSQRFANHGNISSFGFKTLNSRSTKNRLT